MSPDQQNQPVVEAAEDYEDVRAFDAAMAEEGGNIPWNQVKKELGWA